MNTNERRALPRTGTILAAALAGILSLGAFAPAARAAIAIETVAVDNPGNAADTTGYGAVGYA